MRLRSRPSSQISGIRYLLVVLRSLVRASSVWLVPVAGLTGCVAGLLVTAVTRITLWMHSVLFSGIPSGRLSGLTDIPLWNALIPATGGLLLVGFMRLSARRVSRRIVDPVEANALRGGRMSLRDSLAMQMQVIISNGFGASLGLEAGFTQVSSALCSRIGRFLRVTRADMRLLVGCGAAGAIGAAFDAPVAGAFYAFELIIGTYTLSMLAPVATASLCAVAVVHLTGNTLPLQTLDIPSALTAGQYMVLAVMGGVVALPAILLMRGVTLVEWLFRTSPLPAWSRQAAGGLLVGGLALISPTVLSSGHMAVRNALAGQVSLNDALLLLCLKALSSSISIGAGFRGGLFFASLWLGVLSGEICGDLLSWSGIINIPTSACVIAGMCAFAVAVIGGPVTMIFLALETTGSFGLTPAVLMAGLAAAVTTRSLFGYSFTTWRFHVNGEQIRSPIDVGRQRSLTVGRLMQADPPVLPETMKISEACGQFQDFMPRYILLENTEGGYAGLVSGEALRNAEESGASWPVSSLSHAEDLFLRPSCSCRDALAMFDKARLPVMAVLCDEECEDDHPGEHHEPPGRIAGLLSERYVLRRYADEMERSWQDLAGRM
ncbi:chloride channel protein [Acetobacter sp. AN02]|uniref:chloride channel protein n=1 Tax=Acetobacter sp. AN02 TaxID=2894186 RepID=UPI0024345156|nr:chloride channel protein [Acetobacter sp. AN02]MDG6095422.1 chloride channel protein [Acetobacter sp. AN02]